MDVCLRMLQAMQPFFFFFLPDQDATRRNMATASHEETRGNIGWDGDVTSRVLRDIA